MFIFVGSVKIKAEQQKNLDNMQTCRCRQRHLHVIVSECQQETDPASLFAGDLELDLVDVHDALGNGKSETVAALLRGGTCLVSAVEALEDLLRFCR